MRGLYMWSGKWWPGLVPLALLWVLSAWNSTLRMEADLAARSGQSLKDTVLDRTRIAVAGRDVILSADAFSEDGRRSAVGEVEAVPGVRLVTDSTRLVAEVKPFIWSAERDVVRVTLGGYAPLPSSRQRLVDAARASLAGVDVADRIALARGAPPRFDAVALLLVEQIGRLRDGKLTLSDTNVSISGMARDLGGREAVSAALRNLPEGFTLASNDLKAPPYIFQANKDPVAGTLTLSGYVPDNAVHAALVASAERKFFSEKVIDSIKASIGAPRDFTAAVTRALGSLSRLSTGTLVVSDREVRLSGDALFEIAAREVRENLPRDLPRGWQTKLDISVKPLSSPVDASVCQQLFTDLLARARVRFEPNGSSIDPDSLGLLDRLAETALRCPGSGIDIVGHTDSVGRPEENQALSQRRAQAVIDALVRAGLPRERFTATGYGGWQPVAPNDTDAGKAQNRRIEFLVR